MRILNKNIGKGNPCFIIAEIAQAHDGSLGIAHSYIDAVAGAGADAIKFQTHIAAAESSPGEKFRVNFSYEDATRYDYWRRMEFTEEQWLGLARHCEEVGLIFLSSPFSIEAVALLDKIGMPAWKVGSGEVNNLIMLKAMADTNKPILLSSGMSSWSDISKSVTDIRGFGVPLALFQCTSKYPTSLKQVGLNVISEMATKYDLPIGLSDHSGSMSPSLAAISQGADLLEVHVVFDKQMFGPDAKSSLVFDELKQIINFRDDFQLMSCNPVNKDQMASDLAEMRALFNKSIVLSRNVLKGTSLTPDMLALKKPGTGLSAYEFENCVGKKLKKDCNKDHILNWGDFED